MDKTLRNKTAVVGVGYTPFVRKAERSLVAFAVDAALAAIEDAGLSREDIDGLVGSPGAPNASAMHRDGVDEVSARLITGSLGLPNPRFVLDIGGLPTTALTVAVQALTAGLCNYCLVVRAMYNPVGVRYGETDRSVVGGPEQFTTPYGLQAIGRHALWLQRYMHDHGATREDLFHLVKTERYNAQLNPYAYWRGRDITLQEYLESRWVFEPMCIYDCDLPLTGAGAVVVTTSDRARHLRHKPAYITAVCPTPMPGDTIFELAGVDRQDVQVVMLYDGFIQHIWWGLEHWGFCGKGEAYQFARHERIRVGGEFPINTHGGSQGEGRLHGMGHLREATMQIRGRAGERQVPNVQHCLVTNGFEWIPSHAVMLSAGS